jgi:hypothetical protein
MELEAINQELIDEDNDRDVNGNASQASRS